MLQNGEIQTIYPNGLIKKNDIPLVHQRFTYVSTSFYENNAKTNGD